MDKTILKIYLSRMIKLFLVFRLGGTVVGSSLASFLQLGNYSARLADPPYSYRVG